MALSSSLSVASESKYDIFLSFRGVDTRGGFLSHLIKALNQKQIEIYFLKVIPELALQDSKLSFRQFLDTWRNRKAELAVFGTRGPY
ncbi:hypothetical protein Ahy_B08g094343 [Arachis hypogaea]|uniref:TIR domain-containing protein n=1 Tax=Arachis hypogaea TaxID=3818 RepID=A0A444Y8W9_ARAHY|nr:hypothetical protein Ahy_B08g094343 [Arachis hypogaea]